ncbi:MAG: ABC transporter permease [Bacteroidales bacterium]|jgi:ABC-type antimicrobial peptide transport system permease subunit|nr:ABC transporter permease [Bacteroidales bacterium]
MAHNKAYTLFYGVGTVITFVFIILLLQIANLIVYAHPPFINVARTIHIENFNTKGGEYIRGIPLQDMETLFRNTSGVETWSISDHESVNAEINGKFKPLSANFTNADYFTVNRFDFVEGRGFDQEDITNRKQYAVITKRIADKYFQQNAMGKKLIVQEVEYQIIGIVDNYASALNPHENANIWLPYIFNKFVPSCNYFYSIDILFASGMPAGVMKENLFQSLSQYFHTKNLDVDLNKNTVCTIQEEKLSLLGGNRFTYGIAIIIVLLLTIPAINIMTINLSNTYNRVPEIAVRRAMGSGKLASFMQIIIENFIIVCFSLIIAFILIFPVILLIENLFFNTDSVPLLTSMAIRFPVLCITLLLAVVYTLLAGSVPAYTVANKNITAILKGGEQ